jgi:hypothetical protein
VLVMRQLIFFDVKEPAVSLRCVGDHFLEWSAFRMSRGSAGEEFWRSRKGRHICVGWRTVWGTTVPENDRFRPNTGFSPTVNY